MFRMMMSQHFFLVVVISVVKSVQMTCQNMMGLSFFTNSFDDCYKDNHSRFKL